MNPCVCGSSSVMCPVTALKISDRLSRLPGGSALKWRARWHEHDGAVLLEGVLAVGVRVDDHDLVAVPGSTPTTLGDVVLRVSAVG